MKKIHKVKLLPVQAYVYLHRASILQISIFSFFLCIPTFSFGETPNLKEIGDELSGFSDNYAGMAGFMASLGLTWSQLYIGQLVDMSPNWGLGLSFGGTTLKLDHIDVLSEGLTGSQINHDFLDKLVMPSYVLEARIGGFNWVPFDIGIKWGWLPTVPIMADDFSVENINYGIDFRYALSRDWGYFPAISIGFEIDREEGKVSHSSIDSIVDSSGTTVITTDDATTFITYEAWVIDFKLGVAKTFFYPSISIFAGLKAGASFTKSGYIIQGNNISVSTGRLDEMNTEQQTAVASELENLQGSGKFSVDDNNITCMIDTIGINLNTYEGISFNFDNKTFLQFTLMFDFLHLEYGANISFRYQN
ncbi:MAG: hypothetical protein Ta2B_28800 [Termitinemataceae bacterium]|nr:MAG: hypothetical protein Ta2B_28800 [Termitinemataceae bacterium]